MLNVRLSSKIDWYLDFANICFTFSRGRLLHMSVGRCHRSFFFFSSIPPPPRPKPRNLSHSCTWWSWTWGGQNQIFAQYTLSSMRSFRNLEHPIKPSIEPVKVITGWMKIESPIQINIKLYPSVGPTPKSFSVSKKSLFENVSDAIFGI